MRQLEAESQPSGEKEDSSHTMRWGRGYGAAISDLALHHLQKAMELGKGDSGASLCAKVG